MAAHLLGFLGGLFRLQGFVYLVDDPFALHDERPTVGFFPRGDHAQHFCLNLSRISTAIADLWPTIILNPLLICLFRWK